MQLILKKSNIAAIFIPIVFNIMNSVFSKSAEVKAPAFRCEIRQAAARRHSVKEAIPFWPLSGAYAVEPAIELRSTIGNSAQIGIL